MTRPLLVARRQITHLVMDKEMGDQCSITLVLLNLKFFPIMQYTIYLPSPLKSFFEIGRKMSIPAPI